MIRCNYLVNSYEISPLVDSSPVGRVSALGTGGHGLDLGQ